MSRARFHPCFTGPLLLALFLIAAALPRPAVSAEAEGGGPTIMILFDSSGSMWGQLPGGSQAKYAAARDGLLKSLPALDVRARTGLITFGRGCNGIDVVLPPDARPQDRTVAPLESLNPRGKGPLGEALLRAAEQIGTGRHASVIVIHDGPDNCRQDSCAIARGIATSYPGVPIHLVSLGLDEAAADAVSCIAKATGGEVFPVRSIPEVGPAIDRAMKLAMRSGVPAPSPASRTPSAGAERRQQPHVPADGPPHLLVSATLGQERPVDKPVHWRIYRAGDETMPALDILESQFAVPLPAGSYIVQASLGRAKARQTVEVAEKGPTALTIPFQAGIARVSTRFGSGSDQSAELPVLVSVAAIDDGTSATTSRLAPVIIIPSPSSEFVLPTGKYRITAESGQSRVSRDVTITTAEIEEVDLGLSAGQLRLNSVSAAGTPMRGDLTYFLSVDDPAAPGGRREVARTADPQPVLTLPAGTYYINVRSGLYEKHDQVAVGAGRVVSREIILDAARLRVSSNVSIDGKGELTPVVYRVFSLGPYRQEVATSWDPKPEFTLPPGRYRVVAQIGARNLDASQEVELVPGASETLELTAEAAELRLGVTDGFGIVSTNRFWEIRNNDGKLVWRTSQHTPRALLAPGTYQIRCELRDRTLQSTVELAPGQSLLARLGE